MLTKTFYNELGTFLIDLLGTDLGNYKLPDNQLRPAISFVPPIVPNNWLVVGMCEVVVYTGISKPIPLLNLRLGGYQEITINIVNHAKDKNLKDILLKLTMALMAKPWTITIVPTMPDAMGTLEQISVTARVPINQKI